MVMNYLESRRSSLLVFGGVVMMLMIMTPSPVAAASAAFHEDFTTSMYKDAANSYNVTGWSSGEIGLDRESLTLADSVALDSISLGVCVEGDIAYLATSDAGLQVVNVSDPYHAFKIGGYSTGGASYQVRVKGNMLYMVDLAMGFYAFNISNPSTPVYYAHNSTADGYDFDISGNYAYITGSSEIKVVNITEPLSLPIVGQTTDSFGSDALFVSGDYLYSVDFGRLRIYDITNPLTPTFVDQAFFPSGTATDVFVSGNYAYASAGSGGLHIFNVTTPRHVTFVATVHTQNAHACYVVGDFAYIADQAYGLRVADISNPASPKDVGRYDTNGHTVDVYVEGEFAYMADEEGGLQIVRIANTKSPSIEGSYPLPDIPEAVTIDGDYAFVADASGGLQILNITNPGSPTFIESYATPSAARDVEVSGDYAFVACLIGIEVVNISDPSNPSWVDTCNTPDNAVGLDIDGDYVYVADSDSGIQVIDKSNLTALTIVDAFDTPWNAKDVCIDGNYAFVADDTSIQVIDITDPNDIVLAGSYGPLSECQALDIAGDYLYAAEGSSGLRVLDISNPQNPVSVGSMATADQAFGVAVQGDRAFFADFFGGLFVVDITDPTQAVHLESVDTNITFGVAVNGDYIYLADGFQGLTAVEVQQNLCRLFRTEGRAQSTRIFDSPSETVTSVTLTPIDSIPPGTSITYFLSADNGVNWEEVTSGVEHTFAHPGKRLKWRADFEHDDVLKTPTISNLTIAYKTIMDAPVLSAPSDTSLTGNNQPLLEWESVAGATGYLVQIDIADTFNTPWLVNVTVGDTLYSPGSPLSDGIWYWRVAPIDGDGELGIFSSYWTFEVDTVEPTWDEVPEDRFIEFGSNFRYDLNASDPSGIDEWRINSTTYFVVDTEGIITNIQPLSVGDYGIQVLVNDTVNNTQTHEFTLTVQDTTSPTWGHAFSNHTLEFGDEFRYDLNATDLSGLGIWW
ncbi:hypothetical protein EU537_12825, partial [Candidatus Thorarchaeota archaeon]